MKYEYGAYTKIFQCTVRVLVAIVLLLLLSHVLRGDQASRPSRSKKVSVPEAHKQRIARGLAAGYGLGNFKPSLAMKENADFLLTPALLVQEAISDDIIITYPTE